jgi:osmotically inducible protein OsmC
MSIKNSASAKYVGLGKDGKGYVSTESGALNDQPYGFNTRFEDGAGTNPEEQIAAAHASCFAMALSFALAEKGYTEGELQTKATVSLEKDGAGFTITSSNLELVGHIKGIDESGFKEAAQGAKENCPISKLLSCDIALEIKEFKTL